VLGVPMLMRGNDDRGTGRITRVCFTVRDRELETRRVSKTGAILWSYNARIRRADNCSKEARVARGVKLRWGDKCYETRRARA